MNRDFLTVILIAIIVTLTYFLFNPPVKTQRKISQTVPPEQEISFVQEHDKENTVLPDTETAKSSPEQRFSGIEPNRDEQQSPQFEKYERNNNYPKQEQKNSLSYEQSPDTVSERPLQVFSHTPVVKREKRSFEDNLSVCSPYKETMTTEYMGMKMNYIIEIAGWINNKCVLNFESKMLDAGTTFEDTYGFDAGTVEVVGFVPKIRCEFTRSQLEDVGDNILEEKTKNRKMLKDPNQIEIPDLKDMSLSDMKLLKILLSDRACKVVNANDFLQIFESLFSF